MGSHTGRLTTHVLDTAHGKPGRGIAVHLYRQQADGRTLICSRLTNADGRCDQPLLEADAMENGTYELDFDIGSYFAALGTDLPEPAFLNIVTLRFAIADANAHYHVPLVCTPWSYSTYRGS
ncbi:hydroxyisourate hydrolase [Undibacterium oligocarboniphilum]|uniref:5-hydroxyisourate hydrolase n=1 Tax=Undibacterium oligocarboniphilum TaxID=666702 RepID=A0A850QMC8_9BURK|nr:hydroxyisourate hydrolase [Undibacterium oligocarboniphilum]MBC3869501.1 hydroxyisourate hydrolase [Undibacterium oligocarboniphilum]NVO77880.1 hydroxyisourate hydrolase [Undibacterium oligocarboniphilum]